MARSERQTVSYSRGAERGVQRKYVSIFFALLGILVGFCVYATGKLTYFRQNPVDFYGLDRDDLVITYGLTRKQRASLKLGFLEKSSPPDIGVFGNHQFQFWTRDVMGQGQGRHYFFNFIYENLALPELRDYISYAQSIGKLPKKLVIVQITTPNNDNGQYILNYGGELPSDIVLHGQQRSEADWIGHLLHFYTDVRDHSYDTFRYSALLSALTGNADTNRIVNRRECASNSGVEPENSNVWIKLLPVTLSSAFRSDTSLKYCRSEVFWHSAFQPDGSSDVKHTDLVKLTKDENPLQENERALQFGDEIKIAEYINAIDEIVTKEGRMAVFIIPPVYETDRFSLVDLVFDKALDLIGGSVQVLDHRYLRGRRSFFVNYDHPSDAYFAFVAEELKARNLIE